MLHIHARIEELVAKEHGLWEREAAGTGGKAVRRPLEQLRVSLDQCWDLLRRRRALRQAHREADAARIRPPEVIERYEQ